jgi:RecJ-like exonuclease
MTLDEFLRDINNITPTPSNEIIIPKSTFKPERTDSIYCKLIKTSYYLNYENKQNEETQCLICDQMIAEMLKQNKNQFNVSGTLKSNFSEEKEKNKEKNKKNIISSNEKLCPICLSDKLLVYSLCKSNNKIAKHSLCYSCFLNWTNTNNNTCPICRMTISKVYYEHEKCILHEIELQKNKDCSIKRIISTTFNLEELP